MRPHAVPNLPYNRPKLAKGDLLFGADPSVRLSSAIPTFPERSSRLIAEGIRTRTLIPAVRHNPDFSAAPAASTYP